ncbi:hypothetical protein PoB_003283500 [Plakobranchus ocellatus]|uniref:Uncharacterized protein n=1 Tax=Plakobranchus ocellatus TaxID=259542 RepID=A0AAV4AHT0_9GAST|nr:hypothetical protein PoB_003283500 [Plakobranchus ocellatus]
MAKAVVSAQEKSMEKTAREEYKLSEQDESDVDDTYMTGGHSSKVGVDSLLCSVTDFTQKTECLLDFVHDEYEGEGEERERGYPQYIDGAWPSYSREPWSGAQTNGLHGVIDPEDLHERMELDEQEEEGRSPSYSAGRRLYGGDEERDEREWGGDRRRRRKRQAPVGNYYYLARQNGHTPSRLAGTLKCGQTSMIHVLNVTVGYSDTPYCYQGDGRFQLILMMRRTLIFSHT